MTVRNCKPEDVAIPVHIGDEVVVVVMLSELGQVIGEAAMIEALNSISYGKIEGVCSPPPE